MFSARSGRGLGVGGAILVVTGLAARRGVSGSESRLFRAVNGLPDEAFRPIWVPMQYGTFATVPILVAAALAKRQVRAGIALGAAGTGAWYLAKSVKPLVGRGRPASLVPGAKLRGSEEGDLGFPSGHAAVSAALTVAMWHALPTAERWALAGLCGIVSFARLYVGAHLPLDVVGGSALGLLVGSAVTLIGGGSAPSRSVRTGPCGA